MINTNFTQRATVRRSTSTFNDEGTQIFVWADTITNLRCLLVLDSFDSIENAPVITSKARRQGMILVSPGDILQRDDRIVMHGHHQVGTFKISAYGATVMDRHGFPSHAEWRVIEA